MRDYRMRPARSLILLEALAQDRPLFPRASRSTSGRPTSTKTPTGAKNVSDCKTKRTRSDNDQTGQWAGAAAERSASDPEVCVLLCYGYRIPGS
ncbi:hypothetical protein NHX12_002511 [Muraenolepis orangiensis]|uniref:Uncharacterized protein n=1 Tax=Muraenolepis orangiensis TaxID=630683 RepID=A0A9Q0E0Z5_9TELE|nr:hypothetical protein NHX12_002511 [Muraenolepis orangiensis]